MLFRDCIGDTEHVVKGVRPEFDIEVRTNEESTDGTADSSVGAFDRTILMGGVRTGRVNSVVELGEKVTDRGIPE